MLADMPKLENNLHGSGFIASGMITSNSDKFGDIADVCGKNVSKFENIYIYMLLHESCFIASESTHLCDFLCYNTCEQFVRVYKCSFLLFPQILCAYKTG